MLLVLVALFLLVFFASISVVGALRRTADASERSVELLAQLVADRLDRPGAEPEERE